MTAPHRPINGAAPGTVWVSKIMRRVIRSVYSGSPAGDLSSLVNPEAIADIERIVRQGA